ncbi:MAG: hypothetical protein QOJ75_745 [Chloroflexota bacterium]|jgi:hypothetical protein|nr:hypothetical protein [Chloroflexota bacterium]
MRRIVPAILLIAVLAIGGGLVANAAYQAGLNTAVTTAVASGGTVAPVVVPPYGYGYGYGWHPFGFGFGIFGLLFTLFFVFIVFGLIRAILFGGRRGWGRGGWGGPGRWGGPTGPGSQGGPGDHGHGKGYGNPWMDRFGPSFEEWHRQAHSSEPSSEPPASNQGSNAT